MESKFKLTKVKIVQIFYILLDIYGACSALRLFYKSLFFSIFICIANAFFCLIDAWLLIDSAPFKIEVTFIENFNDRAIFYFFIGYLFKTEYVKYNIIWRIFWVVALISFFLNFTSIQYFTPLLNQCPIQMKPKNNLIEQGQEFTPLNSPSV